MNIKNLFFVTALSFLIPTVLLAQGFSTPDSSCINSINFLKNNCLACSKSDSLAKCKVAEFGYLGKVSNRYYYYQISQEYDSSEAEDKDSAYNVYSLTIFEGINSKTNVRAVYGIASSPEVDYFYKPDLVKTKYGNILHIYMTSGNGGWDFGEYYIFRKDDWFKLEVPDFIKIFREMVPKGYWFCRGSTIDLGNMTIGFYVFKQDDACCCPTGGEVDAKLKVTSQNKIVILSSKYSPDTK